MNGVNETDIKGKSGKLLSLAIWPLMATPCNGPYRHCCRSAMAIVARRERYDSSYELVVMIERANAYKSIAVNCSPFQRASVMPLVERSRPPLTGKALLVSVVALSAISSDAPLPLQVGSN